MCPWHHKIKTVAVIAYMDSGCNVILLFSATTPTSQNLTPISHIIHAQAHTSHTFYKHVSPTGTPGMYPYASNSQLPELNRSVEQQERSLVGKA